ncbi:MAG TPA: hypothetical protein VNA13_02990 [Xanthomonadales bacterium]|nr:hypothetical protein [Xanthomonadales bacterium]
MVIKKPNEDIEIGSVRKQYLTTVLKAEGNKTEKEEPQNPGGSEKLG